MEHTLTIPSNSATPTTAARSNSRFASHGTRLPRACARPTIHWRTAASIALLALAACTSTPSVPTAGPAPTDPGLAAISPDYRSAYGGYRSFTAEPVAGWSQVHEEVSDQPGATGHASHGGNATKLEPATTGTGEHAGHGSPATDR